MEDIDIEENNIKMYVGEVGHEFVDWIQLVHDSILWPTIVNMEFSNYFHECHVARFCLKKL
jgi:hypothetical protein